MRSYVHYTNLFTHWCLEGNKDDGMTTKTQWVFQGAEATAKTIVLIHGFGGCRTIMKPLANRLERLGFRVDVWGYHSLQGSIQGHANQLRMHLTSMHGNERRFHIVAHSLGGIIVRSLHAMEPIRNLGRVVFMTPPHHGSPLARRLSSMLGWCLPVLRQLFDAKGSYVRSLPIPEGMEFGELTAHYDFLVESSSMHLSGERDFAVVDGTHGTILFYSQTASLIASFLRTGKFDRD
jgi:pimeloyl-ACP methyl ester carboxylesterase